MAQTDNDRPRRFYVVVRGRTADGNRLLALIEGTPDAEKPDDPSKDSREGPAIIEGPEPTAWTLFNEAGYCWIDRGFKRFWEVDPAKAARIRAGEQVRRSVDAH